MAPHTVMETGVLNEVDAEIKGNSDSRHTIQEKREYSLVWRNILIFAYLHLTALYGLYLVFASAHILTTLQVLILYPCGGFGITAGAHRLWAHRAYKAKWPLRLILTLFNTLAFQDAVIDWARDHRVHHKYSETHADPHNANNGFFFSHVGWLLCKKHPDVKEKGSRIDLSDLYADPILAFQKKHYLILMPLVAFILPTFAPMYFWGESFTNAYCLNILRYCITLNATWLVNSAAHMIGWRPYDKNISPSENKFVSLFALGEGFHNYHHTFPWDYKTAELGKYSLNFSTALIDFFAKIGWAHDLKTVSDDMIKKRCLRTGDGSHEVWGWGDKDQPKEDYNEAIIRYKKD
ncbi:hypothetical protein HHI36_016567 [Cryptolaemus montrouzieri]|uniref:Fatty acid desaturase domain-containing protein n=1 Tax=Cryptolaemus montrouzieri TaxID=559131 RepID=A0ABD2NK23_9CUCU